MLGVRGRRRLLAAGKLTGCWRLLAADDERGSFDDERLLTTSGGRAITQGSPKGGTRFSKLPLDTVPIPLQLPPPFEQGLACGLGFLQSVFRARCAIFEGSDDGRDGRRGRRRCRVLGPLRFTIPIGLMAVAADDRTEALDRALRLFSPPLCGAELAREVLDIGIGLGEETGEGLVGVWGG